MNKKLTILLTFLFVILITIASIIIFHISNIKEEIKLGFLDYKKMDLNKQNINCEQLLNIHDDSIGFGSYNIIQYEYHEKYTFNQCRSEINKYNTTYCKNHVINTLADITYSYSEDPTAFLYCSSLFENKKIEHLIKKIHILNSELLKEISKNSEL